MVINVWVYFGAQYCVPFIYMSLFMAAPCDLKNSSFTAYFEVRQCDLSSFVIFVSDCFGYLKTCVENFCEEFHWNFGEDCAEMHR